MTDMDRVQGFPLDAAGVDIFRAPPPVERRWEWDGVDRDSRQTTTRQSGLPLIMLNSVPAVPDFGPERITELQIKRVIDVAASLLALFVLMPLLVLCALMIKITSPGPVFFRQQREGLDGRLFEVLKFRSMHVAAGDASGVAQTVENDPRVFPLGRFLRKTSIDELPQLINVLRGDMSLVGPRPHVPGMNAAGVSYRELVPYYDLRLRVLPGVTGWAQANGFRGPTDNAGRAKARVDHDIAYVCNFSVWLDIKIILLTIRKEFVVGSGH